MAQPIGPGTVRSSGARSAKGTSPLLLISLSQPGSFAVPRQPGAGRPRAGGPSRKAPKANPFFCQRRRRPLAALAATAPSARPQPSKPPEASFSCGARLCKARAIVDGALLSPCAGRFGKFLASPSKISCVLVDCKPARHLIEERDLCQLFTSFSPPVSPHMLTGLLTVRYN